MADVDAEAEEWIPALEAAKRTSRKFGGLTAAEHALATGLREGLLRAAVESTSMAEGEDAEFTDQDAAPDELLEVPAEAWLASDNWESDRLGWHWLGGEFEIRGYELDVHYIFHGVHFLASEIDAFDPQSAPARNAQVTDKAGSKRGPKTKANKWGALIGALLELERNNRLRASDYQSVSALLEAVRNKIEDTDLWLDERTVEGVLSYIWHNHLEGLARSE